MPNSIQDEEPTETVDIRQFLATVRQKKWSIIVCVAICSALSVAAAFLIKPVYRATTVLVPAGSASTAGGLSSAFGQLGGIASLAGISVGSANLEAAEAISVLTSREFTEGFIAEYNLMPVLFASKWDAAGNRWKVAERKIPTPAKAAERFNSIRSVLQDKKTNLVTVQIDWKDRKAAADWANGLVRRLNAEMRSRAIKRADASVEYLQNELKTTTEISVQQAISRLMDTQIQQKMLAHVTEEYAFKTVDRALPPDADDPAYPKKIIFAILGPVIGLVIAFSWLLVRGAFGESGSSNQVPGGHHKSAVISDQS